MKTTNKLLTAVRESPIFWLKLFEGLLRINSSRLAGILRKRMYATDCFIDTNVFITQSRNFYAQEQTALYHGCYILNTHGHFFIGPRSHLGAYCYVNACYGEVRIGADVAIGPGTKIFSYSNHFEMGKKVTEVRITKNVRIGNNVLIGANCAVLPGAVIPDNVVIGAGSVIKGELSSNGIYGGVPCRLLKGEWYE